MKNLQDMKGHIEFVNNKSAQKVLQNDKSKQYLVKSSLSIVRRNIRLY